MRWILMAALVALVACGDEVTGEGRDEEAANSDDSPDGQGDEEDGDEEDVETPCRCLQPSECICVVISPSGLEPADVSLKGGQAIAWFNDTPETVEVFIGEDTDATTAVGRFVASESISFFPFERTRYDARAETFTRVGSIEVTR